MIVIITFWLANSYNSLGIPTSSLVVPGACLATHPTWVIFSLQIGVNDNNIILWGTYISGTTVVVFRCGHGTNITRTVLPIYIYIYASEIRHKLSSCLIIIITLQSGRLL